MLFPVNPPVGEATQIGAHREQGWARLSCHLGEGPAHKLGLLLLRRSDVEPMHKQKVAQLIAETLQGAEGIHTAGEEGGLVTGRHGRRWLLGEGGNREVQLPPVGIPAAQQIGNPVGGSYHLRGDRCLDLQPQPSRHRGRQKYRQKGIRALLHRGPVGFKPKQLPTPPCQHQCLDPGAAGLA